MADPFISGRGISFKLFGFPVLYRWSALVLPAFFGFPLLARARSPLQAIEIVVSLGLAIGAAILVHELGHAVTARMFGGTARIELVLLGGLTHHSYDRQLGNGQKAVVSVAGTVFGVLAALPVSLVFNDSISSPTSVWHSALGWFVIAAGVWGVFNLIPLPGLDGSHILDALVRTIAPSRAGVIVPVVTTLTAVAAIVGMYLWLGGFAALWLIIIFGPELVNVGERIRRGRDEPLFEEAVGAEEAYRRGDLETALITADSVIAKAGSDEIVDAMVTVRRASLARLGRLDELLDLERTHGVEYALPPLMRARVLATQGRLAEAEAVARSVGSNPEAVALVAELLVAQDLDHRVDQALTAEAVPHLAMRIAELESTNPTIARRLARAALHAVTVSPLDRALLSMTAGEPYTESGLDDAALWLVRVESSARHSDGPGFEHAMSKIPDQSAGRLAQRRLHAIGRHDQAARLGSQLAADPGSRVLLARSLARLGNVDEAMAALDTAVAAGWSDAPEIATNPDLMSLQGRPGWRRLLERMADQA